MNLKPICTNCKRRRLNISVDLKDKLMDLSAVESLRNSFEIKLPFKLLNQNKSRISETEWHGY